MKTLPLQALKALEGIDYAIIKIDPEFPNVNQGSDLDVFVRPYAVSLMKIVERLRPLLSSNTSLTVDQIEKDAQAHVDIISDGKILFRLDLYGQIPTYRNIALKESWFDSLLDRATTRTFAEGLTVRVPSESDELIARYFEYQEFYAARPDKIKHADFILNRFRTTPDAREKFFERLFYYTKLPDIRLLESPPRMQAASPEKLGLYRGVRRMVGNFLRAIGILR